MINEARRMNEQAAQDNSSQAQQDDLLCLFLPLPLGEVSEQSEDGEGIP